MYKRINVLVAMVLALCLLTVGSYADAKSKAEIAEERAEINQLSETATDNLYRENSSARRVIKNCYAYATLSNSSVRLCWDIILILLLKSEGFTFLRISVLKII